jgi:hypothetical protein
MARVYNNSLGIAGLDYDNGTGIVTSTLGLSLNEGDILIACREFQGGDWGSATTPTSWLMVGQESTGTGTAHTGAAIYAFRAQYDGHAPGLTWNDVGNHQAVQIVRITGVDTKFTLSAVNLAWAEAEDTTADVNVYMNAASGTPSNVANNQQYIALAFSAGADNHGGATLTLGGSTGGGWQISGVQIRANGHTVGSDGSVFVVYYKGIRGSTATRQHYYACTNSMRDARHIVYLPASYYDTYEKTTTSSASTSDSTTRLGTFGRTIAESVSTSNSVARIGQFIRAVTDAASTSEAVTRIRGIVRAASDAATTSDVATRLAGFARAATDSVAHSDVATRIGTFGRSVSETMTTSEVISRALTVIRTASEAVSVPDAVTNVAQWGTKALLKTFTAAATFIKTTLGTQTNIETSVAAATHVTASVQEVGAGTDITTSTAPATDIEVSIE